jgi:hypothetical protein
MHEEARPSGRRDMEIQVRFESIKQPLIVFHSGEVLRIPIKKMEATNPRRRGLGVNNK